MLMLAYLSEIDKRQWMGVKPTEQASILSSLRVTDLQISLLTSPPPTPQIVLQFGYPSSFSCLGLISSWWTCPVELMIQYFLKNSMCLSKLQWFKA